MKKAIIYIGLSGSGKTTHARAFMETLSSEGVIYAYHSTDSYFEENGGFVGALVPVYHKRNQDAFAESCRKGILVVICDNTNINKEERRPYVDCAKAFGYEVEYRLIGNPRDRAFQKLCVERNVHGVRDFIVERQARKFQYW